MSRFTRSKPIVLLTGVVMVVLGIAVLVNPIGAVMTLVRLMGWILIAYGAVSLVVAFKRGNPMQNVSAELVIGGVCAVLGLVMAIWPSVLTKIVWTLIGVFVLLTGVLDVIEARDFRTTRNPLATPATVSGVVTALLGVAVILAPLASSALGMVIAAVALLIDGVTEIIFGLGM